MIPYYPCYFYFLDHTNLNEKVAVYALTHNDDVP